jgi:hypothetical protein
MSDNAPILFLAKAAKIQSKTFTFATDASIIMSDISYTEGGGTTTVGSNARIDVEVHSLKSLINNETAIARENENNLKNRIDNILLNTTESALDTLKEIVDSFQTADSNLNGSITSLASDLNKSIETETSRAIAADSSLTSSIDTETSRAIAADSSLTSSIDTESSRAIAAESSLTSSIETETSRAIAAESSLTSSIDTETSRAIAAESSLTSSIDTETSRATKSEIFIETKLKALYEFLFMSTELPDPYTSDTFYPKSDN